MGVILRFHRGQIGKFDGVVEKIDPSGVESLGQFLICRLIEGLWDVDDGCNGSSGSSSCVCDTFHPQRTSWRVGTIHQSREMSWQMMMLLVRS